MKWVISTFEPDSFYDFKNSDLVILYGLTYKGKGAKIATVNFKMGNYNSGKLKGAKLYTVT